MKLNLTSEMRRTMRHWLPLLGWPGMLAMGLLAICFAFYLASIRPLQTRLDVVQHSADAARANILNASATTHRGGDTPTEQIVEFYHINTTEKDTPLW